VRREVGQKLSNRRTWTAVPQALIFEVKVDAQNVCANE
jgi:hypothetical protein